MEIIKGKTKTTYREMIWINGKQIKSPCFKKKTDAKDWLIRKQSEKMEGIAPNSDNHFFIKISLKEYINQWLDKIKHRVGNKTYSTYEHQLRKHVIPKFGEFDLKQLREKHAEELVRVLLSKGHAPSGVNLILTTFKSVLISAKREKFIQFNPFAEIKNLKENPLPDIYWDKTEITQFLRANINDEFFHLYVVALNTGMRRGELGGLCWDRLDFTNGLITVSRTLDRIGLRESTKTNLKRYVPMNDLVLKSFKALMKQQESLTFVFTKSGRPIAVNHLYRAFKNAQKKAGFTRFIRFHDLRHTFASQFMMSGRSIYDLQKILGHTKMEMTLRYAHFSPQHLKDAIAGFNLGDEEELGRENDSYPKSTQNFSSDCIVRNLEPVTLGNQK